MRCVRDVVVVIVLTTASLSAQTALTWQQVKERFEAQNPTLKAAQAAVDESRASDITAYLRPNPTFGVTADGVQVSRNQGVWKAAVQNVELAKVNHQLAVANGSKDPTFSVWFSHNPSFSNPFANETMDGNVSIPLRIFDRNRGEKARTQIDIRCNERVLDATQALVFSDVDSPYYTLVQALNLLRPYKIKYLPMAIDVRDRISFSFKNGGASLLDYLGAEKSYRDTRPAYLNLIGSYLTAAVQMNLAAGREVM